MENTRLETIGLKLIDVLDKAWREPFSTKSDFSRVYADLIAMAASDGLITTRIAAGFYARKWQITPAGLRRLYSLQGISE